MLFRSRVSENDSIPWMTRPFMDVCDMFLFDTMGAGYGGTGKKFDWSVLSQEEVGKPYFLSGGIEAGDEEKLREFAAQPAAKALFAVDINSKFEVSPGIKDIDRVGDFVKKIKSH